MWYLVALILPFAALFRARKPFAGIMAIVFQASIFAWPVASAWALVAVHHDRRASDSSPLPSTDVASEERAANTIAPPPRAMELQAKVDTTAAKATLSIRELSPFYADALSFRTRHWLIPVFLIQMLVFGVLGIGGMLEALAGDLRVQERVMSLVVGAVGFGFGLYYWRFGLRQVLRTVQYRPRRSFPKYRAGDSIIQRHYVLTLYVGIVCLPIAGLLLMDGDRVRGVQALLGAIGCLATGYYGRISLALHEDVDAVAVETLRIAGVIRRDKVLASHQNFDPTASHGSHKGHATIAVLADRLAIHYFEGGGWHSVQARFADLSGIALYDGMFGSSNGKVSYYVTFRDGSAYRLIISDKSLTTELRSFTRKFLAVLDAAVSGTAVEPAGARRRRSAEPPRAPSAPTGQNAQGAPAAATAKSGARALELNQDFVHQVSATVAVPPGRSLDLEFA